MFYSKDRDKIQEAFSKCEEDVKLAEQSVVNVGGVDIGIPVKYLDASVLMVFGIISYREAKQLINSDRLKPVRLFGDKCLLALNLFEYRKSPVGYYNEFTASVPVLLDSRWSPPVLPLLFDSMFDKLGYCVVSIGADTKGGRDHIKEIFPYPMYDKEVSIHLGERNDQIIGSISQDKDEIVSINLRTPRNFSFEKKKFNTYYVKNNSVYNVVLNTCVYWSQILRLKDLNFNFNADLFEKILHGVNIDFRPLFGAYFKKAVEVANAPEKV